MDEETIPADNAEVTDTPAPEAEEAEGANGATEVDDDSSTEDADEEVFVDDEAEEPPVTARKTNKDFIIARKNRQLAKLKEKVETPNDDNGGSSEEPDAEDDGVDLSGLEPIINNHIEAEDTREVESFIAENPDFAPYKAKVMKWMKHESRRALPVEDLFFAVAGRAMMKIGAQRAQKANEKAKQTQAGGGTNREAMKPKDAWAMTDAEFQAEQLRVRRG